MNKNGSHVHFFNDESLGIPLNEKEIKAVVPVVLGDFSFKGWSVNIVALPDDDLREMKNRYFHQDVYTDVISFPLELTEDYLEGELYVSPERIAENAVQYGVNIRNEWVRILIHGLLHLMGYDDLTDDEKAEMTGLENQYLSRMTEKDVIHGL